MIYSDKKIRGAVSDQQLVVGAEDRQINPASINLRLGNTFLVPKSISRPINLGEEVEYTRIELKPGDGYMLRPGRFALATTLEEVNLPNNVSAFVQGRSSIGRIGLSVQNAGFVDPGFHGHITLELKNDNPNPIILRAGYPVTQLVFYDTYDVEKPYSGKYNGQVEATGSRMHMDAEAKEVIDYEC